MYSERKQCEPVKRQRKIITNTSYQKDRQRKTESRRNLKGYHKQRPDTMGDLHCYVGRDKNHQGAQYS